ncbi:heme-binding protein [Kribbella turkmenica]|uniref:Heme-binding protein n=1 Tax=Kribbella turkmenica TaxID=2530375 RepID=A0A4R4XD56_9ACTN|nr:heme-binding protein [Kribbella turkmenica]TDD28369.1 heme-binding protein [Kribbella turkmenica]
MNDKTRKQSVITTDAAILAIQTAISEGAKLGVAVSATVVDPGMSLVAFAKADGATPHSAETSRRKANTAASTRRPTGWMPADLAVTLPLGTGNLLTNVPGGFPLKFDGELVAGLGIAGGTVEQDAAIAKATLSALGCDEAS